MLWGNKKKLLAVLLMKEVKWNTGPWELKPDSVSLTLWNRSSLCHTCRSRMVNCISTSASKLSHFGGWNRKQDSSAMLDVTHDNFFIFPPICHRQRQKYSEQLNIFIKTPATTFCWKCFYLKRCKQILWQGQSCVWSAAVTQQDTSPSAKHNTSCT